MQAGRTVAMQNGRFSACLARTPLPWPAGEAMGEKAAEKAKRMPHRIAPTLHVLALHQF